MAGMIFCAMLPGSGSCGGQGSLAAPGVGSGALRNVGQGGSARPWEEGRRDPAPSVYAQVSWNEELRKPSAPNDRRAIRLPPFLWAGLLAPVLPYVVAPIISGGVRAGPWLEEVVAKSPLSKLRAVFRRNHTREMDLDYMHGQDRPPDYRLLGHAMLSSASSASDLRPVDADGTKSLLKRAVTGMHKTVASSRRCDEAIGGGAREERATGWAMEGEAEWGLSRLSSPYTRGAWYDEALAAPEVALKLWAQHGTELSVRVAVRARPMSEREKRERAQECVSTIEGRQLRLGSKCFTFDVAYDGGCQQETLYNDTVRELVSGCLNGYNSTVLAYGQV